jgi:hypothetical protein
MKITADFNKYSSNSNISMKAKKLPEFDERMIYNPTVANKQITAKAVLSTGKKLLKKGTELIKKAQANYAEKIQAKSAEAKANRLRDFY